MSPTFSESVAAGSSLTISASFRAEIATPDGARETRDYRWRPRLTRQGAILELQIDGRWARVVDELDAVPQRRPGRDAKGFCDASCIPGE